MWVLVSANLRHILRTRLLISLLFFCFLIQWVGLKSLAHLTVSFQGMIELVGGREAVFMALLFQLFVGFFVAVIYGIWMVPYAHRGPRSALTFVLPVSRWQFPLAYTLTFLLVLAATHMVMFLSLGVVFGLELFQTHGLSWSNIALCLGIEALAVTVTMLGLAVSSLYCGQIPTLFFGLLFFFVMQVGSLTKRFSSHLFFEEQSHGTFSWMMWLHSRLPPVGELVFDLQRGFQSSFSEYGHLALWGEWFIFFLLLFRWKLRYPSWSRSTEI